MTSDGGGQILDLSALVGVHGWDVHLEFLLVLVIIGLSIVGWGISVTVEVRLEVVLLDLLNIVFSTVISDYLPVVILPVTGRLNEFLLNLLVW